MAINPRRRPNTIATILTPLGRFPFAAASAEGEAELVTSVRPIVVEDSFWTQLEEVSRTPVCDSDGVGPAGEETELLSEPELALDFSGEPGDDGLDGVVGLGEAVGSGFRLAVVLGVEGVFVGPAPVLPAALKIEPTLQICKSDSPMQSSWP